MPTSPASAERPRRVDHALTDAQRGQDRNRNRADRQQEPSHGDPAPQRQPAEQQPAPQAMSADQDRAAQAAEALVRRPLTWPQRRRVDRLAGAAEILARQLQQRATGRGWAR
jgi:hypothetical protein